ncbi:unnamed protein product [Rotaria sordida]|uniref:TOG domain-containing protein n=1 Tax=Rotaria sordida TaxID=392033 RepID=A0A815KD41_9BILA|nr:unnamed protein product [Rotaria sordida]CAF1394455.1 unnamed protein product [Rotaria sordida]
MSNGSGSSSSTNPFLLPKNDLTMVDSQLVDILLHGHQNNENKIQIVNRWCKNSRHNRLLNILDVSQRYDILLSLVNTLQQTTNTEYQYNCLKFLTELQTNIHHYDQRIYLPAIIQCFSSTSNDVQILTTQFLIKQINTTNDISTFLHIYLHDGLKSPNIRICIKSIEILNDLLNKNHYRENISPIFEILIQYLQDNRFRSNYNNILLRAIQHIKHILSLDLLNTYLESYSPSLRRTYNTYVSEEINNDEETPRASVQVSHIKDSKGTNGFRPKGNNHSDNMLLTQISALSIQKENSDVYSLIEIIRSKWMSLNETNRVDYLERFKISCDKYFQIISAQYPTTTITINSQFSQALHTFLTSILDLLIYITSKNIDLSIKIKLVLSTCLAWLIKHAQENFCKKTYKTICLVFKNILFNGQSNNRQLAKFSVSMILLLENLVHPQLILNELIDEQYQYYNYRIQLELLAIVTATFIKHRQYNYDNILNLNKYLLPMLISNRRELRHGAMECFTVICTYFNSYKPLTTIIIEKNQSIKLILSSIENLSYDALNAFRFRLQRNLLPSLTDEGNITPGLVCDATTLNDPDTKFIVFANNNNNNNNNNAIQTQQSTTNHETTLVQSSSSKVSTNNNKLLQLAMPLVEKKTNTNDTVMRSREIPPLKPPNVDLDPHRYTNNNHSSETAINPTVITTLTSGGPPFDFTVTGNNNYRPLTLTERVFGDDWAKKLSTTKTDQQQENQHNNNLLQSRPAIPHRRFPASHNILVTSQIHNHNEQKLPARHFDSNTDHDEGTDSAIYSRSLSNNTTDESIYENNGQQSKKPIRSVHSSSTRRKVNRLFSNGSDLQLTSVRTLTPENSNESGIYSQSGHDIEYNSNSSIKSIGKDQLFSTKPRLARSGSKPKFDKTQILPSDPLLGQHSSNEKIRRLNNSNVEIVGRAYTDEKNSTRKLFHEIIDDKQQPIVNKPRAKIIKGSVVSNPSNTTTQAIVNNDDGSNHDDGQDIGVIGKAVPMPLRTNAETDIIRVQNNNNNNNKFNKQSDNLDTMSDEFDSDSKENENTVNMGQSLSASFRLRVQQKTQEKIEQKERRRQDRENRSRQQEINTNNNNNDIPYDNDIPISSTSTSRYSSQPDLTTIHNDITSTSRRQIDSNINSILPNFPSQHRFRVSKNFMARSQTFNNRRDISTNEQHIGFNRPLSEDRIVDQIRNPDHVYREAIESISNDDWEQKCSGLNLLQLLIAQYPDTITQNLHQVVLILIQEVKNLRSQVARFALSTFCDMFKYLKRNMDIELDITVKAIIQKSAESNEFFRSDAEKCLQMMVENVTLQKALQALIAGGASHRNPAARKTSAKCIYLVCEKLGPTKILSGTRDITERVLQVAATFASDGPPEIRWYGKKIYHMLMPYDELDSMMKHYLNPTAYTNMCEILDSIRAKGGVGETPSESARNNGRRALSNDKLGSNGSLTNQFSSTRKIHTADQAEQVRELTKQMRSSDFRERLNGIEEFQKLCELETDTAIQSLVQIFDGFNDCLADMNSKVVLKALNTMHQVIPILGDALSSVVNSALPLIAHNIASKNREISQLASDIIDTAIEYIDCGVLIQPLCTLSQNSNLRIRPEIVLKLANLAPRVCQRKPKQVEIHLLPTYWKLLSLLRGQNSTAISSSASGSNSLNSSIHVLTMALYTELGSILIEKASSSSLVTPQNLQVLRELCTNINTE